jgi:tetratricopeptide (TPR) repeat protein
MEVSVIPARSLVPALILAALAAAKASPGPFEEGEALFRANKPAEAAARLEQAVGEAQPDERAWIYLGVSYQMLGRLDDAASVLRKGLGKAERMKHVFYFDLGNVFTLQGRNSFAVDMYGQSIDANGNYAPAYLNRANARIGLRDLAGARSDYEKYLELEPRSPQRPQIEEVLKRIGAALAEVERHLADAEAKRAAEEAARRSLLEQVAASLKAAADETTSISAGSGSVQGYGDELKIEE